MNKGMKTWQYRVILLLSFVFIILGGMLLDDRPVAVGLSFALGILLAVLGTLGFLFLAVRVTLQEGRDRRKLLRETQICPACNGSGRVAKEEEQRGA